MNDVQLFGWLLLPGIHYDTNCNVYLPLLRRHPTYKTKTIPVYRDTTHFLPFSTTYRLLTQLSHQFCVTFLLKQVIHRSNVFKIEGVDTPRSCSLDRPLVVHIEARTGAIQFRICDDVRTTQIACSIFARFMFNPFCILIASFLTPLHPGGQADYKRGLDK